MDRRNVKKQNDSDVSEHLRGKSNNESWLSTRRNTVTLASDLQSTRFHAIYCSYFLQRHTELVSCNRRISFTGKTEDNIRVLNSLLVATRHHSFQFHRKIQCNIPPMRSEESRLKTKMRNQKI